MNKPKILDEINTRELVEVCKDYINYLNSDEYTEDDDSDYSHLIFEKSVEAIFGPTIWDWVCNRIEEIENEHEEKNKYKDLQKYSIEDIRQYLRGFTK